MDKDEPLHRAAARELQEETSVDPKDVLLTQVKAGLTAPAEVTQRVCVTDHVLLVLKIYK